MRFSVIIPAHNEEHWIEKCLRSIELAKAKTYYPVEVIVCLNRCTDRTEEISKRFGAIIVQEPERNISKIRNTAAKAATGDVLITIDADSRMSENLLTVEDLDFAKRLKERGKKLGKKYGTLWNAPIVTSARKFDRFGDWYFFKNPKEVKALFHGAHQKAANKFYYDFKK